jgi:hypothetical protein
MEVHKLLQMSCAFSTEMCVCSTPPYFGPCQLAHVMGASARALRIARSSCLWQSSEVAAVVARYDEVNVQQPSTITCLSSQLTADGTLYQHPREVRCQGGVNIM